MDKEKEARGCVTSEALPRCGARRDRRRDSTCRAGPWAGRRTVGQPQQLRPGSQPGGPQGMPALQGVQEAEVGPPHGDRRRGTAPHHARGPQALCSALPRSGRTAVGAGSCSASRSRIRRACGGCMTAGAASALAHRILRALHEHYWVALADRNGPLPRTPGVTGHAQRHQHTLPSVRNKRSRVFFRLALLPSVSDCHVRAFAVLCRTTCSNSE